jgi:hypothetical protein
MNEETQNKQCSGCKETKSMINFMSKTIERKMCIECREADRKRHSKPEVRERRNQQQREMQYYKKYREKKRNEDEEAFLKRNADMMKNWRTNNNEHHKAYLRGNFNQKIKSAKQQAAKKGIEWKSEMTNEYCEELMRSKCYYCNNMDNDGLNGIDRMDNNKCYEKSNCTSCCKKCNFMKKALDTRTFIERCMHISLCHGDKGNLHPSCWVNRMRGNYTDYKQRALKKGLDFELSNNEFVELSSRPCYYCKKENEKKHSNGLDRTKNDIGYTLTNVVACCAECNSMKASLSDTTFIDQCKVITNRFIDTPLPELNRCYSTVAKRVIKNTE